MKLTKQEKIDIYKKILVVFAGILFFYFLFNYDRVLSFIYTLIGYARPIIIGFILAFVVNMITIQYEKLFTKVFNLKNKRVIRIITVILGYLTLALLLVFLVSIVLPQFLNSVISLVSQLPDLVENTINRMQDYQWFEPVSEQVQNFVNNIEMSNILETALEWLRSQGANWLTGTVSAVGTVFSGFVEAFLGISLSVYIIFTKEKLSRNSKELLYATFSERFSDRVVYVLRLLYKNFYNFFTGQFLEAILLGCIVFVGVKLIGAPYGLMLGVTTAMLNLIPYIGAVIAAFIGTILLMMTNFTQGLMFFVYIIIAQQIDGNIIYPRLVGSKMGIPPFWMMIAITVGGAMMGIVGMVIFVPIFSTLYTLAKDYSKKRLEIKNINIEEK